MTALEKFKKLFSEELDDPNESFLFFLLSLIPKEILEEVVNKGSEVFYDNIEKY